MSEPQAIKIGQKIVGPGYPTYIIFEVASTHAKDWTIAKNYVKQAQEVGADAIKFQLFTADTLLNPISSILRPTYDYFKTAETPRNWFPKLAKLCKEAEIDLLCTPFDENAASFLNEVGVPAIKIASGDLTYHKLLEHVAKFGKPVILSTGVANLAEVEEAVDVLKNAGCQELAILQCVSIYPMPYEAANVKVVKTFKEKFNTVVGYSDNGSAGIVVPLVAVALGASVIEKHVTSQKQRGSMDDVFSLSIEEFGEMVHRIRRLEKDYKENLEAAIPELKKEFGWNVEEVLGNGIKEPSPVSIQRSDGTTMSEWQERRWVRRGIYPKIDIPKGTTISEHMLIALRPDIGVSSVDYQKIFGATASEDLSARHPIKFENSKRVRLFQKTDLRITYNQPEENDVIRTLEKTAMFD